MSSPDQRIHKPTRGGEEAAHAALSQLVSAAREDEAFRERVLFVLKLPALQRESMVRSAVAEMELRGEPATIRTAFLFLATAGGAEAAVRLIDGQP